MSEIWKALEQKLRLGTRQARRAIGLRLDAEYVCNAAELAARAMSSPPGISFRVESDPANLRTYDNKCRDLNPQRRAGPVANGMALAERIVGTQTELVGYWGFYLEGKDLVDQSLFVAPAFRGQRIAEQLLWTAASMHLEPEARLIVTTGMMNRAMNRVAKRAGMTLFRVHVHGEIPLKLNRSLYPGAYIEVGRRSHGRRDVP